MLVDVTDDRLVKDSALWYEDDGVTLLIDGDYSRGAAYDGANDFELGFRWNDPAIGRGTNSAPVPAGVTFAMTATANGYRLEVKAPLAQLGIAAGYGRLFGLDVQVNDDDEGDALRDARIAWWAQTDDSWAQPSLFGAARLEGPEKVGVVPQADGTGMRLKWTHFAWNDAYEVHKAGAPYFTADGTTRVAELPAPASEYLDTTGRRVVLCGARLAGRTGGELQSHGEVRV